MQIFHWQMFSVHTKRNVNMHINHLRNVAVAEDIKRFWQEEAKQEKLLCFMKLDTLSISNTQTHVSPCHRIRLKAGFPRRWPKAERLPLKSFCERLAVMARGWGFSLLQCATKSLSEILSDVKGPDWQTSAPAVLSASPGWSILIGVAW